MPKHVDHDQRRREIAAAVARLAATEGLQGITFREVASEAGVSVSLVQHYFGTKENLLVRTLNIRSEAMGERILARLDDLSPRPGRSNGCEPSPQPSSPTTTRAAPRCCSTTASRPRPSPTRRSGAQKPSGTRRTFAATSVTSWRSRSREGQLVDGARPDDEARAILSMILGLSLTVLLDGASPSEAYAVLDAHLARLAHP